MTCVSSSLDTSQDACPCHSKNGAGLRLSETSCIRAHCGRSYAAHACARITCLHANCACAPAGLMRPRSLTKPPTASGPSKSHPLIPESLECVRVCCVCVCVCIQEVLAVMQRHPQIFREVEIKFCAEDYASKVSSFPPFSPFSSHCHVSSSSCDDISHCHVSSSSLIAMCRHHHCHVSSSSLPCVVIIVCVFARAYICAPVYL